MAEKEKDLDPLEPIKSASPPIRTIIKKVLQLEKEHLYEDSPRLKDDIVRAIKQEILDDSRINEAS